MSLLKTADFISQVEDLDASIRHLPNHKLSAQIVVGRRKILEYQSLLAELSSRSGQHGAMDHLEHFLTAESSLRKTPYLVLVGPDVEHSEDGWRDAVGALLIYEYRLAVCGTGIFATDDVCGRRTLIAPPHLRTYVARLAAEALLRAGALIIVQSWSHSSLDQSLDLPMGASERSKRWVHATRRRAFTSYLPLESTMDVTLAKIGQKTRFNLRYYRRRAEAELGCSFVAEARMSLDEFQSFNRRCSYAVGDDKAKWRYETITRSAGMFLCAIKGDDGDWLSILGGRRYHDAVEIDWQMNRSDLPVYSLSTVLRSYFMEHEIAKGTKKMYIEGGTPHAMRHSFTIDVARDLVVLRHPSLHWLVRTLVSRLVRKKNFLVEMLTEEQLKWQPWF
jgi:hypothetical protein